MKIFLLLLFFLHAGDLTAATRIFHYSGKKYKIEYSAGEHITMDRLCYLGKEQECEGYRALSKVSLSGLTNKLKGGANRGAVICKHQLKQKLFVLHDQDGNMHAFCRFPDDSLVGTGTLSYFASKNDRKKDQVTFKL